ncbi:MAG: pentapeptide repeat-containing protein [Desulfobacter sp.]|nr:MAG: pentapeptide repeat-containing protein [Desulfobacter sp.]
MPKFTDQEWEEYLKEHQSGFEGNPEHLRVLLEQGVDGWNEWRDENPEINPNLSCVDLEIHKERLSPSSLYKKIAHSSNNIIKRGDENKQIRFSFLKINFNRTNLERANLSNVDLEKARLGFSNLRNSKLQQTRFQGAYLQASDFQGADLFWTDLKDATMNQANLQNSLLVYADFTRAIVADIKYTKEIRILGQVFFSYNTIKSFHGINVGSCIGNQVFRRYAMDQDFIETFKKNQPDWLYKVLYYLWRVSSDCGQSILLWVFWSILIAIWFAAMFAGLGEKAFVIPNLDFYDFDTLIYYSVVTFTTLGFGDITPKTPTAAQWVMAEVITGYIMLGGLISIFATKLARRS